MKLLLITLSVLAGLMQTVAFGDIVVPGQQKCTWLENFVIQGDGCGDAICVGTAMCGKEKTTLACRTLSYSKNQCPKALTCLHDPTVKFVDQNAKPKPMPKQSEQKSGTSHAGE